MILPYRWNLKKSVLFSLENLPANFNMIPVQRKLSFGYLDANAADERSEQSKCQLFRFHCTGVTRQSSLGLERYILV